MFLSKPSTPWVRLLNPALIVLTAIGVPLAVSIIGSRDPYAWCGAVLLILIPVLWCYLLISVLTDVGGQSYTRTEFHFTRESFAGRDARERAELEAERRQLEREWKQLEAARAAGRVVHKGTIVAAPTRRLMRGKR